MSKLEEVTARMIKEGEARTELEDIAREFCRRVEAGEVRSTHTYGRMKEALKTLDKEATTPGGEDPETAAAPKV